MFEEFREKFISLLTSRIFILMIVMSFIAFIMLKQVFDLQIVHGEEYLNSFETKIRKEKTIEGARGNIYDRNGNILAYNELAHSVTIEDVYESGTMKSFNLNNTIYKTINIIEGNNDNLNYNFKIELDRNGEYQYTVEGTQLLRFIADVYGLSNIEKLSAKQRNSTCEDIMNYLCGWDRFRIGKYTSQTKRSEFIPGYGYTKEELLKIVNVRFDMNNNSFQKYISTTIANDVSEKTVAMIKENSLELEGVDIAEGTVRKYVDPVYFSNIIGYTGKVSSTEELETLQENNISYTINDTVGKLGIEKSMENYLQGQKGHETLFVNSVGKTTEVSEHTDPVAGNDIYLTIDKNLQIAVYKILEKNLASILYTKIINAKTFDASAVSASKIMIPIYDVYIALIENNVIDIEHLGNEDALENERYVHEKYLEQKENTFARLNNELLYSQTPYEKLSTEYQVYESYIVEQLYQTGVIDRSLIDPEDETYIAWTIDEVISCNEYINYCIAKNYVNVDMLKLDKQYSDSQAIYEKVVEYILDKLYRDDNFRSKIYKYMIKNDVISGASLCRILIEQDVVELDEKTERDMLSGNASAYSFMMERIKNLEITPAQLALDPCSASSVITDVNTGDVLALVSYPGFDNNKLANGVDLKYYAQLQNDKSTPMINYATRHKTAPGSTFKMVSATAGLMEGVLNPYKTFYCNGIFEKITPAAKCWAYPSGHGSISVTEAIQHSCNVFFYETGFALGQQGDGYNSDYALSRLAIYADLYGLTDLSGVEIEESMPTFSQEDGVRSAIGQGTNAYTTVQLARYVTTIANSGTCYNLTLLDKVTDRGGNLLLDNSAEIRNEINMDSSYWSAIQQGMRKVVLNNSNFSNFSVEVAGKTGTAEESRNRANHALFICYAPYRSPQISVATRLAFGYSSSYAARTTKDVLSYYFNITAEEDLITGEAQTLDNVTTQTD